MLGATLATPAPASAIAAAIAPAVTAGSLTIGPAVLSAVARAVDPSAVAGSLVLLTAPASAIATSIAPGVLLGSSAVTPPPAAALGLAVPPGLLIDLRVQAGVAVAYPAATLLDVLIGTKEWPVKRIRAALIDRRIVLALRDIRVLRVKPDTRDRT